MRKNDYIPLLSEGKTHSNVFGFSVMGLRVSFSDDRIRTASMYNKIKLVVTQTAIFK